VDIMYGEGVSREGEVIDIASDLNILEKSGAWYSYNGEKVGQGKENVKQLLKENKELMNELEEKVREHYGFVESKKEQKKEE
ncbi:MAG: DNA recombination/repair protein RecA, partial [Bacilli bacterium]|nr:DNA recombination/repair protein RecA [Bacilli bacterium]